MSEKTIYVRAKPESVQLTETYYYSNEISRNRCVEVERAPTGRIKIEVPYDGYEYFTLQAYEDVEQQLGGNGIGAATDALIGYISFTDYGQTDLNKQLALSSRYGSLPLQIPIRHKNFVNIEQLRDDRHACVVDYSYSPNHQKTVPIDIVMELLDEDTLSLAGVELSLARDAKGLGKAVAQIAQQVNFRRNLLLIMSVVLSIPLKGAHSHLKPSVKLISLRWPTITSLDSLQISAGPGNREIPVKYNPSTRSLEWRDVPMVESQELQGSDTKTYTSEKMFLLIDQPGELYRQEFLEGHVEVEVPDYLLSGLRAQLYNATGRLIEIPGPELTTKVITTFNMILDDAFARRYRSTYQHLHFDEIIPEERRVDDIKKALTDLGFRITKDHPLNHSHDEFSHFLQAQRQEGPDIMKLWIFVEGKRYGTERQTGESSDQTYTTHFESGDMKVNIGGEKPGDVKSLVEKMNALQAMLRDRFAHLKAKR